MIWFLISTIVVIVNLIHFIIDHEVFWGIIVSLIIAIALFSLSLVANILFESVGCSNEVYLKSNIKIHALADRSKTSVGGFIFVSVNQENVYTYMKENSDGTYEVEEVRSRGVKIKESNTEEPSIKVYNKKRDNIVFSVREPVDHTLITIPEGSITNTYNADLE